MSADNGVYIFPIHRMVTGTSVLQGFLVRYYSAVENVTYNPTHPDGYDHSFCDFEDEVSKKPLIKTKAEALAEADQMASQCSILEYGIRTLEPYVLDERLIRTDCLLCNEGVQHSNCTSS